jgi:hypothetical protein
MAAPFLQAAVPKENLVLYFFKSTRLSQASSAFADLFLLDA